MLRNFVKLKCSENHWTNFKDKIMIRPKIKNTKIWHQVDNQNNGFSEIVITFLRLKMSEIFRIWSLENFKEHSILAKSLVNASIVRYAGCII